MVKWLYYIILLLVVVPSLSSATSKKKQFHFILAEYNLRLFTDVQQTRGDTIINKNSKKQREEEEKNKIKEIAKAKKQLKPEKITDDTTKRRKKLRPDGMERPPEIIRRNGG